MWDWKDCQYKDRCPWISTGNPRVMSHSYITLDALIPAYRKFGWRETWPRSRRGPPQTPLCPFLPFFLDIYYALCLHNITTNEVEC